MIKAKKLVTGLLLVSLLLASLVGCSPSANTSGDTGSGENKTSDSGSNWPKSAVEIVLPYSPGGEVDLSARIFAKYLTQELGENFVVTNMPGASGSICYDHVANSDPDGHTLTYCHDAKIIGNVAGVVQQSYKDFEIGGMAVQGTTQVWSARADSEYNTVEKIVEKLKQDPGSLSFATILGGFTHLEMLAFQDEAGVELKALDVGASAADHLSALLGGHVDIATNAYTLVKDYVETGELVVLGNVSAERDPFIPDIPTFKEQGVNLEFSRIYPFYFPKGTPKEVIDRFSSAIEKISQDENFIADMEGLFLNVKYYSPEETTAIVAEKYDYINSFDELKPNN